MDTEQRIPYIISVFMLVIGVIVFSALPYALMRWISEPFARSIAFLIAFLPYYFFLPDGNRIKRVGRYLLLCGLTAVAIFAIYKWGVGSKGFLF